MRSVALAESEARVVQLQRALDERAAEVEEQFEVRLRCETIELGKSDFLFLFNVAVCRR